MDISKKKIQVESAYVILVKGGKLTRRFRANFSLIDFSLWKKQYYAVFGTVDGSLLAKGQPTGRRKKSPLARALFEVNKIAGMCVCEELSLPARCEFKSTTSRPLRSGKEVQKKKKKKSQAECCEPSAERPQQKQVLERTDSSSAAPIFEVVSKNERSSAKYISYREALREHYFFWLIPTSTFEKESIGNLFTPIGASVVEIRSPKFGHNKYIRRCPS